MARRGDNIPPVSDYAHWNEDAERMWYEENKYDMMYADEWIEDDDYYISDEDDEQWADGPYGDTQSNDIEVPPLKRFRLGIILEIDAAHIEQAAYIFYHKLQDESINYKEEVQ